jgi:hypothetical protein
VSRHYLGVEFSGRKLNKSRVSLRTLILELNLVMQVMQIVSLGLLALGIVGVVVGGVKFRQQTEWEHWAAKMTALFIIGGGALLVAIGTAMFFFV